MHERNFSATHTLFTRDYQDGMPCTQDCFGMSLAEANSRCPLEHQSDEQSDVEFLLSRLIEAIGQAEEGFQCEVIHRDIYDYSFVAPSLA